MTQSKATILFFASNPDSEARLALDEEVRAITQKIRASEQRDALNFVTKWATRPDDLLQELNEQRPTIVHFSGHGGVGGELILTNDKREARPVPPAALRSLFATLKGGIRLVVLNACYSERQARAIAEEIDCVIGMSSSIGDDAAITFAASLYRAIGFGRSVQNAFEQGKRILELEGIPEETTPQLVVLKDGVDAARVQILQTVDEANARERLRALLSRTSVRDIAMLRTATTCTLYPKLVSDLAVKLAPPAITWELESESDAQKRAHRLVDMGLLEWRSTEVETTPLGKRLIDLDDELGRGMEQEPLR